MNEQRAIVMIAALLMLSCGDDDGSYGQGTGGTPAAPGTEGGGCRIGDDECDPELVCRAEICRSRDWVTENQSTGGVEGTGGASATGGTPGGGGVLSSGGVSATGGIANTGGAMSGTGGMSDPLIEQCGVTPGCGVEGGACCILTTRCTGPDYCHGSSLCCNGTCAKSCANGVPCGEGLICDASEICLAFSVHMGGGSQCADDPCFPQNLDCSCGGELCTGSVYCLAGTIYNRTLVCGNATGCAAPHTPIATPTGDRRIAEIKVGDLVYSVDNDQTVAVRVAQINKRAVAGHRVQRVVLSSGVVLEISGLHPTADGRTFDDLRAQGVLDGVEILSVETVEYRHDFTYDILPDSDTGAYFAGGVLIGSTLGPGIEP